jgi:hypothetical protein
VLSFSISDHLQEQADELEALQAIFPDEYQSIGEDKEFSHKLSIVPNQSGDDNHGTFFYFDASISSDLTCRAFKQSP